MFCTELITFSVSFHFPDSGVAILPYFVNVFLIVFVHDLHIQLFQVQCQTQNESYFGLLPQMMMYHHHPNVVNKLIMFLN